jgi:hypothetical protein
MPHNPEHHLEGYEPPATKGVYSNPRDMSQPPPGAFLIYDPELLWEVQQYVDPEETEKYTNMLLQPGNPHDMEFMQWQTTEFYKNKGCAANGVAMAMILKYGDKLSTDPGIRLALTRASRIGVRDQKSAALALTKVLYACLKKKFKQRGFDDVNICDGDWAWVYKENVIVTTVVPCMIEIMKKLGINVRACVSGRYAIPSRRVARRASNIPGMHGGYQNGRVAPRHMQPDYPALGVTFGSTTNAWPPCCPEEPGPPSPPVPPPGPVPGTGRVPDGTVVTFEGSIPNRPVGHVWAAVTTSLPTGPGAGPVQPGTTLLTPLSPKPPLPLDLPPGGVQPDPDGTFILSYENPIQTPITWTHEAGPPGRTPRPGTSSGGMMDVNGNYVAWGGLFNYDKYVMEKVICWYDG